jgi:hypothetical protein
MENIAYASQVVRDHMKAQKSIEACTDIKTAYKTRPDVERQAQLTIDAINKRPAVVAPLPRKTAKSMFNEVYVPPSLGARWSPALCVALI